MNDAPEIALIIPNTLTALGLRTILEEVLPNAVIRTFRSFNDFVDDTPDMYAHYFITANIYFEHTAFFMQRSPKAILLTSTEHQSHINHMPSLNIYQDEKHLVKELMSLHQYGHHAPLPGQLQGHHDKSTNDELTKREIQVLALICHGLINKEIAEKLHISQSTVVSHRKNITTKLGIKSVASLTVYAVMNGYIDAERI